LEDLPRRHELDTHLIAWLWPLLTDGQEIERLIYSLPHFIQSFSQDLRDRDVPLNSFWNAIDRNSIVSFSHA
jgi:hypothetical protein